MPLRTWAVSLPNIYFANMPTHFTILVLGFPGFPQQDSSHPLLEKPHVACFHDQMRYAFRCPPNWSSFQSLGLLYAFSFRRCGLGHFYLLDNCLMTSEFSTFIVLFLILDTLECLGQLRHLWTWYLHAFLRRRRH